MQMSLIERSRPVTNDRNAADNSFIARAALLAFENVGIHVAPTSFLNATSS
jgi:hypothetical protein